MNTKDGQSILTKSYTKCFCCNVDRLKKDIYFKYRSIEVCLHCVLNGLTSHAEPLFTDDELMEVYYKKVGL